MIWSLNLLVENRLEKITQDELDEVMGMDGMDGMDGMEETSRMRAGSDKIDRSKKDRIYPIAPLDGITDDEMDSEEDLEKPNPAEVRENRENLRLGYLYGVIKKKRLL